MVILTEEIILDQLKEYNINRLHFPPDKTEYAFDIKHFKFVEDLGKGSFGVVKKCVFEPNGKVLAAKFAPFQQNRHENNEEKLTKHKEQFELHKAISESVHKNIVEIYGCGYIDSHFIIFMESMDYSLLDFYKMVKNSGKGFPESLIGCIAAAVINGLVYCAEKKIIHRDLKPGNILINYSHGSIKLCDFGASRIMLDSVASTYVGTIAYWPPERFDLTNLLDSDGKPIRPIYDVRADVWSLGITLAEVVKGQLPYESKNEDDVDLKEDRMALMKIITEVTSEEILESCFRDKEDYSQEFRNFIQACLNKIESRPKYDTLMEMAFYKEYTFLSEAKISLIMIKTISEAEIEYQKELVKKNNLEKMTKEIETIADPSTTNVENSELDDEGIVTSGDPVNNCFKAIFGREEFDDTIFLAPPPYSENLEAKNSISIKEKLALSPGTYDSGISTSFGSFKSEAIASEIGLNEAETSLAKAKIDLTKEKFKLAEIERKEVNRHKTNSDVSKNAGENVTNFHVSLNLSNLAQESIDLNNSPPTSEISNQNFNTDEKLDNKQESSTLSTSLHTYKNWPIDKSMPEILAEDNEKENSADQNKDAKQDDIYHPPFPDVLDLSNQRNPSDLINPSGNLMLVVPEDVEPLLMKETLATQGPLDETQDLSLIDNRHSSAIPEVTSLPVSSKIVNSNQTDLIEPPSYMDSIGKFHKQTHQTLNKNDTKEEIHTASKSKNTTNPKRQLVEVTQDHPTNIKQRPKIPTNFQSESRKVAEFNEQKKLEETENLRQERQTTKQNIIQIEDQAKYAAVQIDPIIDPIGIQEEQGIDSSSVSIQSMDEDVENKDYKHRMIAHSQYPILPQAQNETPKSIQDIRSAQSPDNQNSYIDLYRQDPFYDKTDVNRHENNQKLKNKVSYEQLETVKKETSVLTNKALSKEYELPHKNIEDVSLYPTTSTAGSNIEIESYTNEAHNKYAQDQQMYYQAEYYKEKTKLARLKVEAELEAARVKNLNQENLVNLQADAIKPEQKAKLEEPYIFNCLKLRAAVMIVGIIGIFVSLIAIASIFESDPSPRTYYFTICGVIGVLFNIPLFSFYSASFIPYLICSAIMIFIYGTAGIYLIVNGFILPTYFMDFIINNYGYFIYGFYSSLSGSKGTFNYDFYKHIDSSSLDYPFYRYCCEIIDEYASTTTIEPICQYVNCCLYDSYYGPSRCSSHIYSSSAYTAVCIFSLIIGLTFIFGSLFGIYFWSIVFRAYNFVRAETKQRKRMQENQV